MAVGDEKIRHAGLDLVECVETGSMLIDRRARERFVGQCAQNGADGIVVINNNYSGLIHYAHQQRTVHQGFATAQVAGRVGRRRSLPRWAMNLR